MTALVALETIGHPASGIASSITASAIAGGDRIISRLFFQKFTLALLITCSLGVDGGRGEYDGSRFNGEPTQWRKIPGERSQSYNGQAADAEQSANRVP